MGRIRITVGSSEGIDHPRQPAIVAEHDVRIRIVGEKRRQRRYAIAHIAPHQQPAIAVHIIAERQLGQVAAVEGDNDAAQEAAQHDAARALVGGKVVALRPADN